LVSTLFNFTLREEWTDTFNPAAQLPKPMEQSRDRLLTDAEILQLWAVCEAAKAPRDPAVDVDAAIAPMVAIGVQVLLTARRPGEVFACNAEEIFLRQMTSGAATTSSGPPRSGGAWCACLACR